MSWDQRFFDPISLPGRKPLLTLRDAALYITKLSKAVHDANERQARPVLAPLKGPRHQAFRLANLYDVITAFR